VIDGQSAYPEWLVDNCEREGNFAGPCPVSKADLRVQREVLS
jgi:hypothetical protein